jgi:hypothetical protein
MEKERMVAAINKKRQKHKLQHMPHVQDVDNTNS